MVCDIPKEKNKEFEEEDDEIIEIPEELDKFFVK